MIVNVYHECLVVGFVSLAGELVKEKEHKKAQARQSSEVLIVIFGVQSVAKPVVLLHHMCLAPKPIKTSFAHEVVTQHSNSTPFDNPTHSKYYGIHSK